MYIHVGDISMKYDVHISFDSRWNPLDSKLSEGADFSNIFQNKKKNTNKNSHYVKVI